MSRHERRRSRSPGRSSERPQYRDRSHNVQQDVRSTTVLPESFSPLPDIQLSQLPTNVTIHTAGKALPSQPTLTPCGQDGRKITVLANHFKVLSLPDPSKTVVWQYSLRFRIPSDSQRRGSDQASKQQTARAVLKVQSSQCFGQNFVFDGVSKGYSTTRLVDEKVVKSVKMDMLGHSVERPNQVQIDIKIDKALKFGSLVTYLKESNIGLYPEDTQARDCILALTAILHEYPANHLKMFSRKNISAYFKRWRSVSSPLPSTGGVLEAVRGMVQAVSIAFGGQLLVNVDTRCSAFFVPGPCLIDVALAFAGIPPGGRVPPFDDFVKAAESLIGVGFTTKHGPKKDKTFWVKRIVPQSASKRQFDVTYNGETRTTTTEEYFLNKYSIRLRYADLPMVETLHEGVFPMELCFVAEDVRYKEPLQGKETADFITACTTDPPTRMRQIHEHLRRLRWHDQPLLQDLGICIKPSMLEVRAQTLTAPKIIYGQGSESNPPADGSWNLMRKQFARAKSFKSWGLLYLPGKRMIPDHELQDFCKAIAMGARSLGVEAPSGPPAFVKGDVNKALKESIQELVRKAGQAFRDKPALFFLIHDGSHPSIYKSIKNICDLEGYVSQVMIAEKALKTQGRPQYSANIAMKLNAKLGGVNHHVQDKFYNEPTMLLGADVSHPSPSELRTLMPPPSYAAVVGSMDSTCALYSAVTMGQPSKQELITTLTPMFEELLKRFQSKSNVLPKQVIYWRDGIGETQVQAFKETEIQALLDYRKAKGLSFKLTVILCIKRHHTRFFPKDSRDGDRKGNIPPGTMIENGVKVVDFFSMTQKVIQGVGRPTRYSIVYDELELTMSDVQRLVMAGCFSYARASRSVGLHSAAYHADLAAEKAKYHLRTTEDGTVLKDVHSDLKATMWWQ